MKCQDRDADAEISLPIFRLAATQEIEGYAEHECCEKERVQVPTRDPFARGRRCAAIGGPKDRRGHDLRNAPSFASVHSEPMVSRGGSAGDELSLCLSQQPVRAVPLFFFTVSDRKSTRLNSSH